uniref:DNA-directed RNA polymerase omega chain n=1 Tax=Galdieria phlegrea TaxID=1389228 RepID=UPI0023D7D7B2|nr:DNA-directed RNA polymerase omega chain [Galdieria phlegrea]WDA99844.1 DNA-directed RNA polymerase omega chain [Galdieria phlegrea]
MPRIILINIIFESEYLLYQTEKLIKKSNNLYYTAIEINNKAKHYSNESGIEIFRLKPIVRAIIELAHQV